MKVGSIVKFKDGLYADEKGALYLVTEDNGDRVFIQYICKLRFPPETVAHTADLELVKLLDAREIRQNQEPKASKAPRTRKKMAD